MSEHSNKKALVGVCNLIKKSSMEIHIPGQDGEFRKYTGSLVNFIQDHTYNALIRDFSTYNVTSITNT